MSSLITLLFNNLRYILILVTFFIDRQKSFSYTLLLGKGSPYQFNQLLRYGHSEHSQIEDQKVHPVYIQVGKVV